MREADAIAITWDMESLCSERRNHFRNLMIVKTVHSPAELVICTEQELAQYGAQASELTLESVLYAIDLLQETMLNIKKGVNRRIEMEMALIRLCSPSLSTDMKAVVRRLSIVENALKNGARVSEMRPVSHTDESEEREEETDKGNESADEPQCDDAQQECSEQKSAEQSPVAPSLAEFDSWQEVLTELGEINRPLWGILADSTAFIRESENKILINSKNPALPSFIKKDNNAADLRTAIMNVTGSLFKLSIFKRSENTVKKKDSLDELIKKVSETDTKLTVIE
ncbi:MAG: hypothetical protein MJ177_10135 [Clostridia bacterium]|nr:hypothetical protein [Clostridia bacterium]